MWNSLLLIIGCWDSKETYTLPSNTGPHEPHIIKKEISDVNAATGSENDDGMPPPPNESEGCRSTHNWRNKSPKNGTGIKFSTTFITTDPIDNLLVDFINPEGEIIYGTICPNGNISIEVPKDLGEIYIAIFVDENQNGPSKDDLQGFSDTFLIQNEDVHLSPISSSEKLIPKFNYAE
jgi:hypothetical protein